jgi:hypothetical protein
VNQSPNRFEGAESSGVIKLDVAILETNSEKALAAGD